MNIFKKKTNSGLLPHQQNKGIQCMDCHYFAPLIMLIPCPIGMFYLVVKMPYLDGPSDVYMHCVPCLNNG